MATFFIFVVITGQYSGERLKDYWFSGLILLLKYRVSVLIKPASLAVLFSILMCSHNLCFKQQKEKYHSFF